MFNRVLNKYKSLSLNSKTVVLNVFGAFVVKGAALLLSVFILPAYLRFFDDRSVLGLWFTIVSILSWFLNFDLGIGNGLRNQLVKALTQNNKDDVKKYITSAYVSTGIVTLVFGVIFWFILDYIDWNWLLNIRENSIPHATLLLSIKITVLGIIAQFFFRLISFILYAIQYSFINNLLVLISSLGMFLYVILAIPGTDAQNMLSLAIVNAVTANVPLIVVTILIFSSKLRYAIPRPRFYSNRYAKSVLGLGLVFFLIQVAYMILVNTNEFLITFFTGSNNVVDYQIYQKLFTLIGVFFSLVLTPISSIVIKALEEKKHHWVNKLYQKLFRMACMACVTQFTMVFFLQPLLNLWLQEKTILVNYWYAICFAMMGSLMIFNGVLSSIANGLGKLQPQLYFFGLGAILKLSLAWGLVTSFASWIGIILTNIIVLGTYCFVQTLILNRYFRKMIEVTDS